jgi:hypothetical protein
MDFSSRSLHLLAGLRLRLRLNLRASCLRRSMPSTAAEGLRNASSEANSLLQVKRKLSRALEVKGAQAGASEIRKGSQVVENLHIGASECTLKCWRRKRPHIAQLPAFDELLFSQIGEAPKITSQSDVQRSQAHQAAERPQPRSNVGAEHCSRRHSRGWRRSADL